MFIKQTMELTKAGLQRSQLTKLPFHFDSKRHLSQLASFDFSGNFFSQSDTILLVGMASLIGKNFDEHCFHFHDAPDKWPSWLSAPPKLVDWVHFSFSRVIPKIEKRDVSVLSNVTPRYLGSEQKARVSLLKSTLSSIKSATGLKTRVAVKHNAGESVLRAFNNTGDFENGTCGYSVSCSELMGGCKGNSSRALLPLTRPQCSIHCESSREAHGANWRRRPLVTL